MCRASEFRIDHNSLLGLAQVARWYVAARTEETALGT